VPASWWKKLLLAPIVVLLLALDVVRVEAQATESPALCYAYLSSTKNRAIDLYIACEGKHERITSRGDFRDFAVSLDGSTLALLRQLGKQKVRDSEGRLVTIHRYEKIQVVSLKPGFQTRWFPQVEGAVSLQPSCGTILAVGWIIYIRRPPSSWTYKTYNVLTGQRLSLPPYVDFACSADGNSVVGYLSGDRRALWAGRPPQRMTATAPRAGAVPSFDISPDGRYVAYCDFTTNGVASRVCLDRGGDDLGCVPSDTPEKISVSDWGGLLYDNGTGGACPEGACEGVYYWQAGTGQPRIVEPVGWHPQWITPDIAVALRAWKSHLSASGGLSK